MGRLPYDGAYFATQTLLGGDPDRNRRTLYRWPSDKPICHFNYHMNEWTAADQQQLDWIIDTLNAAAVERPRSAINEGFNSPDVERGPDGVVLK